MKKSLVIAVVLIAASILAAPQARASNVLVAQCVEYSYCWNGGPNSFSHTFTYAELVGNGFAGNTETLVAAQTAKYVIRLGSLTITQGSNTVSLGDDNGGFHDDPCDYCEIDTLGTFAVAADGNPLVISGTFGNSEVGSTAGVDICFGDGSDGPCTVPTTSTPEPASVLMLGLGMAAIGLKKLRK